MAEHSIDEVFGVLVEMKHGLYGDPQTKKPGDIEALTTGLDSVNKRLTNLPCHDAATCPAVNMGDGEKVFRSLFRICMSSKRVILVMILSWLASGSVGAAAAAALENLAKTPHP